jgi:hypothetical protein
MRAALTTFLHFSISAVNFARNSAGVVPAGSTPTLWKLKPIAQSDA